MDKKRKWLIALPIFSAKEKGFDHPTILVSADTRKQAIEKARKLKPELNIGEVKEVEY